MRNALTVVALLALVVLAWLAIVELATPSTDIDDRATTSQPPDAGTVHAKGAANAEGKPAQASDAVGRQVEREERVMSASKQGSVALEGRCVDKATGKPVQGCKVRVHGWGANDSRIEAYRKLHGEVVWEDPKPQTTGADGKFSFRFVPPPPYQFVLEIEHPRFVSMHGRWDELLPDTKKDFGDVLMRGGSAVRGRVVDTDGVPQAGVWVYIDQYNRYTPGRAEGLSTRRSYQDRTRSDGTFAFDEPIAYGDWNLRLRGRQKLSPESLSIPDGQSVTVFEIETKALGDVQTITGRVVDEMGVPVARADVEYSPRAGGGGWLIYTKRDGSFRIERRANDPDGPVQLRFEKRGYENLVPEPKYPWDTHGLELAMKRGVDITVVATDAKTGEPVEDYGVRCIPERGSSSLDYRLREAGHHTGGRVTLAGVRRGPRILVVEPRGQTWLDSDLVHIEVDDHAPRTYNVKLSRPSTRTLVVRVTNGKPVAGTKVELLRAFSDQPVSMDTFVFELGGSSWTTATDKAIRLMDGRTDAQGELVLRGPGDESLAVRVLGPGHQPVVERDVKLTPDAPPIVVEVPSGATITGKIGPPRMLEQFRSNPTPNESQMPGLFLAREVGQKHERYPANNPGRVPLNEDGTFEVAGIPPGTWDLHFAYTRFAPGRGVWTGRSEFIRTLTNLRDGETRELVAELDRLVLATVAGKVLLNGKPASGATLQLTGKKPDGKGGEQWVGSPAIKLGEDGGFRVRVVPGTYRAGISMRSSGGRRWTHLFGEGQIMVLPGKQYERVVHITSGVLRIRIVGPDDEPRAGIQPILLDQDGNWAQVQAPKTDEQGRATIAPVPAKPLTVTVLYKRFLDQKARQKFLQANRGNPDAWKLTRIEIGRVRVNPGDTPTEVELKLPAAAGY